MIDLNSTSPHARTVECWFDYSSPFAYLGTTQIERVAREHDARVLWRPFLLGALFKQIGTPLIPLESYAAAKSAHARLDLLRWADHWGVPFRFTTRFPLRTVDALRVTLLLENEQRAPLVHAIMRACWVDELDPADPDVLRACLREASIDPALLDRAGEAKQRLFDETTRAIEIGAPGAPCFVVGDQLFWGQDRFEFVGKALAGWRAPGTGSRVSGST